MDTVHLWNHRHFPQTCHGTDTDCHRSWSLKSCTDTESSRKFQSLVIVWSIFCVSTSEIKWIKWTKEACFWTDRISFVVGLFHFSFSVRRLIKSIWNPKKKTFWSLMGLPQDEEMAWKRPVVSGSKEIECHNLFLQILRSWLQNLELTRDIDLSKILINSISFSQRVF